jgi:hypothetical protein
MAQQPPAAVMHFSPGHFLFAMELATCPLCQPVLLGMRPLSFRNSYWHFFAVIAAE